MKRIILLTISALFLAGGAGIGSALYIWPPRFDLPSLSPVLVDYAGETLCTQLTPDEKWRLPLALSDVPPLFIKMLVAYEDRRFYSHYGADPIALMRAGWQWFKNRRVVSGGSTLTMQTVRLLQPHPRTLFYKIWEIFQALWLEQHYSKDEILKMYLTLAPYGGNIEGLRAASLAYFQRDLSRLTPSQMALLVAIPQSPTALRPNVYPLKAKKFRTKVLQRMSTTGILTCEQAHELSLEPVPAIRYPFPAHASHVMALLRRQYSCKLPSQTVYKTTLHKKTQVLLEEILRHEIPFFDTHQTAAALIVENSTRNIVAYAGSADPLSEAKNGFVDMVQAVRSPGSTLKPLIYALAFEENIIHPETLVNDVSTSFNGYTPANFRDAFHGEVSIREALQQSLNIPAVRLLDWLGPGRFMNWLKTYKVSLFLSSNKEAPGLPIALGGVGIRFYDLVSLYCALANEGKFVPLALITRSAAPAETRLVSTLASWYVTQILEGAPAPPGFVDWFVTEKTSVAFKTGTSYGARDALCIGYTAGAGGYTVGVWTGRPDGSPAPNQLGRKTAAPLLFKIFNAIGALSVYSSINLVSNSPVDALNVPNHLLPESLRRFPPVSQIRTARHQTAYPNKTRILSPATDTTFMLQPGANHQFMPIPLVLQNASPPWLFLVNGQPAPLTVSIKENQKIFALWVPPGTGFYALTFIDGKGYSDTVTVRLVS